MDTDDGEQLELRTEIGGLTPLPGGRTRSLAPQKGLQNLADAMSGASPKTV
jgi:hypothetical protein